VNTYLAVESGERTEEGVAAELCHDGGEQPSPWAT